MVATRSRTRCCFCAVFIPLLLVSFLGAPKAALPVPGDPGLLALLYFDGNTSNAAGGENAFVVGNPVFPSTDCVYAQCIELNGNDAVSFDTLFDIVPPQWTVEIWARVDAYGCAFITGKRQGGDFIEHYVAVISTTCSGNDHFNFFSWAGVGQPQISIDAPNAFALGRWYLLTFTFDGANYRAYVDGQIVGTQAGLPIPNGTAHNFRIGNRQMTNVEEILFFNGRLDTFAAYARALTAAEVLQHYQAGAPGGTAYSCAGFDFPFDEPISLKAKVNRAIPLQMQLSSGGTPITDANIAGAPPVVNVTFSAGGGPAVDVTDDLEALGQSSEGNAFSYALSGQWIFRLGTKPFKAAGTYTVTAAAGDTTYSISPTCTGQFVRSE